MASNQSVKTKLKTTCPECGAEIKLEDTIAAPLIAEKTKEFATKEKEFEKRMKEFTKQEAAKEIEFTKQLEAQKQKIEAEALKTATEAATEKAKADIALEMDAKSKELEATKKLMAEREEKLKLAQEREAQFLEKERLLGDKERELNLTVQKQVSAAKEEMFKKAQAELGETQALKLKEKDEQLSSMQKKIEDLQRRASQGSQQLQGEALELQLEEQLAAKFPHDTISPVGKGVSGADIQQFVITQTGQASGSILWELKQTKNWSNDWIPKLKTDQRNAGAEIAILVSNALPQGVETFNFYEGVYVCSPRYVLPLALILRQTLMGITKAKVAQLGQKDKMTLVYEYLTGSQFKHRIEGICEQFQSMQDDLNKEKAAMNRMWAKRDKQINTVIENTVGLHGDLEGIAGQSMPQIEGLEIDLLANEE